MAPVAVDSSPTPRKEPLSRHSHRQMTGHGTARGCIQNPERERERERERESEDCSARNTHKLHYRSLSARQSELPDPTLAPNIDDEVVQPPTARDNPMEERRAREDDGPLVARALEAVGEIDGSAPRDDYGVLAPQHPQRESKGDFRRAGYQAVLPSGTEVYPRRTPSWSPGGDGPSGEGYLRGAPPRATDNEEGGGAGPAGHERDDAAAHSGRERRRRRGDRELPLRTDARVRRAGVGGEQDGRRDEGRVFGRGGRRRRRRRRVVERDRAADGRGGREDRGEVERRAAASPRALPLVEEAEWIVRWRRGFRALSVEAKGVLVKKCLETAGFEHRQLASGCILFSRRYV